MSATTKECRETDDNRKHYIDSLRTIAIICVVCYHTLFRVPINIPLIKPLFWLGVPIFLLISGALILPKAAHLSVASFYTRYAKRIIQFVILIPICGIVTNAMVWYCCGTHLSLAEANSMTSDMLTKGVGASSFIDCLIKAASEANGIYPAVLHIGISHTWYLYLIAGLYLLAPFLGGMIKNLTTKELWILCIILFIAEKNTAFIKTILNFFHAPYLIYYVMGYVLIVRKSLKKNSVLHKFTLLVAVLFYLKFALNISTIAFSSCLMIYGIIVPSAIILIFRDYITQFHHTIIRSISECSFGIYLWHFVVLWFCCAFLPLEGTNNYIQYIVYFLISFITPWIFTAILKRFRWIRWIVA